MKTLIIGKNVANIGNRAMASCDNLTDIYFKGDEPVVGEYVFLNANPNCKVHVDLTMPGWSQYVDGSRWNGMEIVQWEDWHKISDVGIEDLDY